MCALETELESKGRSGGGSSKIRRVTKGKSGSKARKSAGVPKVEHVGDELSELESLEQVAHVGIASSSKLEAVGELIPTGKTDIRLDTSEISEKCEVGLNPRFSNIFAEDPPAERISSRFPSAGSASGSAHERNRVEETDRTSQCGSVMMDSVPATPDILLLYWTLVKDGVLLRGHESQFANLETEIQSPVQTTSQLQCGSTREIFRASERNNQSDSRSISSSWQLWTVVRAGRRNITMVRTPGVMQRML